MSDGVIKFIKQNDTTPSGSKKLVLDSASDYERLCEQLLKFDKNKYYQIDKSREVSGVDTHEQIKVEVVGLESLAPGKKSE